MSTRNLPGGKGQLGHKADNRTAISQSTVYKMWKLKCLTTLWDSKACYRDGVYLLINWLWSSSNQRVKTQGNHWTKWFHVSEERHGCLQHLSKTFLSDEYIQRYIQTCIWTVSNLGNKIIKANEHYTVLYIAFDQDLSKNSKISTAV
jgi:hypothetical protein